MSRHFTIPEAAQLAGIEERKLRSLVREIKLHGNKQQRKEIKFEKGEWEIGADLLEVLATQHQDNQVFSSAPPSASSAAASVGANPYADRLIDLLEGQMAVKDEQIGSLHHKVDTLLERVRELNVIVHDLQKKLALPTAAAPQNDYSPVPRPEPTQVTPDPEPRQEAPRALETLPPQAFASWLQQLVGRQ